MNRRTFLRSIATVCGAAVVCPGELVKPPVQRIYRVSWHDFKPFNSEADRKKYRQNVFIKARQQGCTNSTLCAMHNFNGRRSGFIITRPE